jgi:two-component system, cell cycle response regulator
MTAKILIVDDLKFNIDLLEEHLQNDLYEIHRAYNGQEALSKTLSVRPDLILMDVMMPVIDGLSATKTIRQTPEIAHIPIIMITALTSVDDRINSLFCGADDYMNKPINYLLLKKRIKSLLRLKYFTDEIILRAGIDGAIPNNNVLDIDIAGSKILIIDEDTELTNSISSKLKRKNLIIDVCKDSKKAIASCLGDKYSLIILNTEITDVNAIELCVKIKNNTQLKSIPILVLVDEYDEDTLMKSLEIGINDYFLIPHEISELIAKVILQIKKFHYVENLRMSYLRNATMDELTQTYNRNYLESYFKNLIANLQKEEKRSIICVIDIDDFKKLNDVYGHITGDKVLKSVASIFLKNIRSSDFIARIGGEEFIVILHDVIREEARLIIDKLREKISNTQFLDYSENNKIKCTISGGIDEIQKNDSLASAVDRADKNLYKAKNSGKNMIIS